MHKDSIEIFYNDYAEIYYKMSKDRDFLYQTKTLISHSDINEPGSFLELFAGPAYHGLEMKKKGWSCLSIDYSKEMANLALNNGLSSSEYLTGLLPTCLEQVDNKKYNIVTCLRYSIGYLSPTDISDFFYKLDRLVMKNTVLFIELHQLPNLFKSLEDLSIRERIVELDNKTSIKCVWPYGDIQWDRFDIIASMDILFEWYKDGKVFQTNMFETKEYIHSAESINRVAKDYGWELNVITEEVYEAFPGSEIIKLVKHNV